MQNLIKLKHYIPLLLVVFVALSVSSCNEDDDDNNKTLSTMTYNYTIHNGQTVPSAPYLGGHPTDFNVQMEVSELSNGNAEITLVLNNTISGATYNMHAHDSADPTSTPNGTPYNESPNIDVLATTATGNGNTVTVSKESNMSFDEITTNYSGFFVVHDPLQSISTVDISTYLVVGGFARMQADTEYQSVSFDYNFNSGQLVPSFAYLGSHSNSLSANIQVDELAENKSRVTVRLDNTIDGQTYHSHAHDMADAATTPNGTPYIESPNADVFATPIAGNGGLAFESLVSTMSYADITTSYDGFFVVHDPLQAITTVDPTTYVILGVFAR